MYQAVRMTILMLLLVASAGCGQPALLTARNGEFPLYEHEPLPTQITSFIKLYEQNCQACHGALIKPDENYSQLSEAEKDADGRFGPAPPLSDPLFLAIVSDDDLRKVIAEGRPGTLMPAFAVKGVGLEQNGVRGGPLTDEQVNILIKGIRGRWGDAKLKGPFPTYRVTDPASGNLEAGKKLFKSVCADCHSGKRTLDNPDLLALMSDQMLRRIIITGRPDLTLEDGKTHMPDFRGTAGRPANFKPLTDKDIADLMALLISWRTPQPKKR
ncbi:MAG: cytochrome c [Gemmataceae bacterium]